MVNPRPDLEGGHVLERQHGDGLGYMFCVVGWVVATVGEFSHSTDKKIKCESVRRRGRKNMYFVTKKVSSEYE